MCYDLKNIPVNKSWFKKKNKKVFLNLVLPLSLYFLVYSLKEIDERSIHKF